MSVFSSVAGMSSLSAESVTDVIFHQCYWLACISSKDLHFLLQVPGERLCVQTRVKLVWNIYLFIYIIHGNLL